MWDRAGGFSEFEPGTRRGWALALVAIRVPPRGRAGRPPSQSSPGRPASPSTNCTGSVLFPLDLAPGGVPPEFLAITRVRLPPTQRPTESSVLWLWQAPRGRVAGQALVLLPGPAPGHRHPRAGGLCGLSQFLWCTKLHSTSSLDLGPRRLSIGQEGHVLAAYPSWRQSGHLAGSRKSPLSCCQSWREADRHSLSQLKWTGKPACGCPAPLPSLLTCSSPWSASQDLARFYLSPPRPPPPHLCQTLLASGLREPCLLSQACGLL